MYCRSCGAEMTGKFCQKCGTSAENAPPTAAPVAAGMPDNLAAALTYIPIVGVIFLLLAPYNKKPSIRFNAFQSLLMLGVFWVVGMAIGLFYDVSYRLGAALYSIRGFAYLGLTILCAVKAYQNDDFVLPVIGPIAKKQG